MADQAASDHVEARLRVRYAETDQMGVVYHANYLVWMEVGRVEYCRAVGHPLSRHGSRRHSAGGGGGELPVPFAGASTTKK